MDDSVSMHSRKDDTLSHWKLPPSSQPLALRYNQKPYTTLLYVSAHRI